MIMLLALGCTGGTIQTSEGDDFALAFDGNSCVEIPVSAGDLPTDLTIEATVRGSVDHEPETPMPVAVWWEVFALAETKDGRFLWGPDEGEAGTGVYDTSGIMDGQIHHVAGTWASDGKIELYVDGGKIGFSTEEPSSVIGDWLQLGCWDAEDAGFEGTIDEVRLSSVVRYTEPFEPPTQPYEVDGDTVGLWHFDEGEGDIAHNDASTNLTGSVLDAEWVDDSAEADD
jgi:hypothetical protein